jgi:hypothetical protein
MRQSGAYPDKFGIGPGCFLYGWMITKQLKVELQRLREEYKDTSEKPVA